MARNIIKLAGGTYSRLKELTGSEALQDREVVIAKDTHELYVGTGDGSYKLLSNVHIGEVLNDITSIEPVRGRFFYSDNDGYLYLANGVGWKKVSVPVRVANDSALEIDESTGELRLKIDMKSIITDRDGNLSTGNQDFGEF